MQGKVLRSPKQLRELQMVKKYHEARNLVIVHISESLFVSILPPCCSVHIISWPFCCVISCSANTDPVTIIPRTYEIQLISSWWYTQPEEAMDIQSEFSLPFSVARILSRSKLKLRDKIRNEKPGFEATFSARQGGLKLYFSKLMQRYPTNAICEVNCCG